MNKKILFVPALLLSSQLALAASITSECADGKITLDIEVDEGQVCDVTQTVMLNGVSQVEEYSVMESGMRDIPLNEGDSASASAQMQCRADGSVLSFSTSVATGNGCVGAAPTPGEMPIGEIPGVGMPGGEMPGGDDEGNSVEALASLQEKLNDLLMMVEREVEDIAVTAERFSRFGFSDRYVGIKKRFVERKTNVMVTSLRTMYKGEVSDAELNEAISAFEEAYMALMESL